MYPADFSTTAQEEELAGGMEGAARPGHFRGVTTVVAKLFNVVLPTTAVFGAKDFQQAAVIRRMTRDLDFPVKIVLAPTLREADGLAMSSRNKYLSSAQREQATVLWRAILRAQEAVARRPAAASQLRRGNRPDRRGPAGSAAGLRGVFRPGNAGACQGGQARNANGAGRFRRPHSFN